MKLDRHIYTVNMKLSIKQTQPSLSFYSMFLFVHVEILTIYTCHDEPTGRIEILILAHLSPGGTAPNDVSGFRTYCIPICFLGNGL